jgi:hypothetical protein
MEEFEPWLKSELADKGGKSPKVIVECNAEFAPGTFKACCDVVVETTGGGRFHGAGALMEWPKNKYLYDLWYTSADKAVTSLKAKLASGAALDDHLVDQLIFPASLARGTSRILAGKELDLHAQSAIHIAEKMVPGVKFNVTNPTPSTTLIECTGISRVPGAEPVEPPAGPLEMAVAKFPKGILSEVAPEEDWVNKFHADLGHFAAKNGIEVMLDQGADKVMVRGAGVAEGGEWKGELEQLFKYYELADVKWR